MDVNSEVKPSPKYWMSLEQWRQDPEFLAMAEKEFLTSPLQSEDGKEGWARREFLKLMGASLALTTFGCVRRPAQKIIPYAKKPDGIVHGLPNFYASSMMDGMEPLGILVTTRDGRPIKIEGNPDHPANKGGMSGRAHAAILKLYDPDRFNGPKHNLQNEKRTNRETINVAWEKLDEAVAAQLAKGQSALLMGPNFSPSTQALVEEFTAGFGTKLYRHEDGGNMGFAQGQAAAFGQAALPSYSFDKAKVIVAINNDFLGTWMNPTAFNRQFIAGRKADQTMNKLIVFESLMSLTGSNADKRFRIRPSQSLDAVMAILHELVVVRKVTRYASDVGVQRVLSEFAKTRAELGVDVASVADDLWKNRGQSLVVAGGLVAETEHAEALYVAVNLLNSALENDGKTVEWVQGAAAGLAGQSVGELIAAMNGKQVKTLIIHGCNPMYSLPASAKFREALANVEMVIYTGDRNDETGRFADYVATDHHALEAWGDLRTVRGEISIQQPTIEPLYNTRAFQDSMLAWMKKAEKGSAATRGTENWYEYLRGQWRKNYLTGNFEDQWVEALQKGVVSTGRSAASARTVSASAVAGLKPAARKQGFELALYETVGIGDGSLANVPWLQEFPDPITKIVWDNYACFSLRDAAQLKIKEGSMVALTVAGQKLTVPAHIQPGQADGVIGLAVGYGRDGAGQVADGVGVNAYTLAQFVNGRAVTSGLECSVEVGKGRYELSSTQGHHTMEGRQIVVEETLADHIKKPGGNIHRHNMEPQMWGEHKYTGNKWVMVIDLNSCTGCGACVIACQSENNIPTVGRKHVAAGREMHWLRIDRYYTGTPEDPDVVHQPLPCMHCDNAPCETVCPVVATAHSDEGTNDMIYNRCVGTRYCSNNCPYKVRRFNWFDYTQMQAPKQMALNPEVTVRFRGVMEKCTFCIHRIRHHKSQAKFQDRKLRPDEFTTACAQSCPTSAIKFGDYNNPEWTVTKEFKSEKAYALLEELNTKPAVRYQVKVRNSDKLKNQPKHHGPAHGKGHDDAHGEEGHHS